MQADQRLEGIRARQPERRKAPRLAVDEEAVLVLVHHGSRVPCRILELSLTGCRLSTRDRFLAGTLVRVETAFKVRGMAFRLSGVTEWTDGKNRVGIRFLDLTARRRVELVEVLGEIAAEQAARAVKQAAQAQSSDEEEHAGGQHVDSG
jgi:hypothetical protein